jgi:hypothetical protein
MLSEIEDVRGKLGLPVERDLYFKAEHRLSTYAKIAASRDDRRLKSAIRRVVATRRIAFITDGGPT